MSSERFQAAPVVVFAYNRPNHLQMCLNNLNKNELAENTHLFIYVDGCKSEADKESNEAVIEIANSFQWVGLGKDVILRNSNFGLAQNIVEGVTWIIQKYGKVIVVEDDIEASHGFLKYMNDALVLYQDKPEVMHINGYLPETRFQNFLPETFFSRFMNCWGWATWAGRWKNFSHDSKNLLKELRAAPDYNLWNFNNAVNFEQQLEANISKQIITWAVHWNVTVFLNHGLCLTPGKSMVRNVGTDGSGVHYNKVSISQEKTDIEDLANNCHLTQMAIKESKRGRIYLTLFYGLGRAPKNLSLLKFLIRNFLNSRKFQMKKIISSTLKRKGYSIIRNEALADLQNIERKQLELFKEFYFLCQDIKFSSLPSKLSTNVAEALQNLIGTSPYEGLAILNSLYQTKSIEGDVCEFGIAQGATSRLLGAFLLDEDLKKRLVLVDSFEGLSNPTSEDELKDDIFNFGNMADYAGSMAYPSSVALTKLEKIKFPKEQLNIIPGFIQDSINTKEYPESVSFAYVDFDLFKPIQIALAYLNKVVQPRGVIIVDDYDFFSTGAKKAVDLFMMEHGSSYKIEIPEKSLGHFCVIIKR